MRRMRRQARRGAVRFTDAVVCTMLQEEVSEEDVLRALATADDGFQRTSDEGHSVHCFTGLDLEERTIGVLCRFERAYVRVDAVFRT